MRCDENECQKAGKWMRKKKRMCDGRDPKAPQPSPTHLLIDSMNYLSLLSLSLVRDPLA